MLQPKRTKFRKMQKGRVKGMATRGHTIAFGQFGLKALEGGWITARQLEAARIAVTRAMKREGQVWIRIFPDKPITRKPAEVRMGKGKGAPEYWVAVIKPGTILFEAGGVNIATAKEAMKLAEDEVHDQERLRRTTTDKMKNSEIKALNAAELQEKIGSEQEALRKMQFAHQVTAIENPMKLRESRKLIARLHTELRAKELQK